VKTWASHVVEPMGEGKSKVTLEIRHWFHDKIGLFSGSTEAEWYAYSVAWLAFAGAVLALGLVYRNEWLRRLITLAGAAFAVFDFVKVYG